MGAAGDETGARRGVEAAAFEAVEKGLRALLLIDALVALVVVNPKAEHDGEANRDTGEEEVAEVRVEQGGKMAEREG